jgi:serine/threonine protein kinase
MSTLLQERYRIVEMIGQGGMATVYQAEDLRLPGKAWAVKEMRADLLPATDRLPAVKAFRREAELLARLEHPSLPRVIDHFSEASRHYLVMEYLEGQTLQEQIEARQDRPFKEKEVVKWALQICDALDYLHTQDRPIIYRDLKPGNIIVDQEGTVKLIDFGIARYFDPSKKTDTLKMGTSGYAPPEQYQGGGQCDARSDIYALGATMHHLLTGRDPKDQPPFSFGQARLRKLNPDLSEGVEYTVKTALAYNPAERYQTAAEMREALLEPEKPAKTHTSVLSQPSVDPAAAGEVTHLPQTDDLFQVTMTEIEGQTSCRRAQAAAIEQQQHAELNALYSQGEEAIQSGEWSRALEILEILLARNGASADLRDLAREAETGWLQSVLPETAHLPVPNQSAKYWATLSGSEDLHTERVAARYVPHRNYQALHETLLRSRMLILTGPPGIGKLSTALALARELNEEKEWPLFILHPGTPPKTVDEIEGHVLVWPNPFGLSTFYPPRLADRADILETALERNYLISTTTAPLRERALCTTTLGLWPDIGKATATLSREHYTQEDAAEILDRHANLALRQGTITARQRDLLAPIERRLELASFFNSPLAIRLFVEQKLSSLDPTIAWSTRDLQLMATEMQGIRQLFTQWFVSLNPADRLFLTILTWLAERPRAEIRETYAALTHRLRDLEPDLPVTPISVLIRNSHFCVSGRGHPHFKHPCYQEVIREVVTEVGQ